MSRSAFAVKFKRLVGETPLEYLTNWRMHKATALLRNGDKKLADVARTVGHDSDAAFSKAFRRTFGVPPGDYERTADVESVTSPRWVRDPQFLHLVTRSTRRSVQAETVL
jgi:AraC-like DNA-binding protein